MLSIYRLPNQQKNEKIIKVIRRDLFILVKKILFLMVLILLPMVFFYLIIMSQNGLMVGELSYPIIVLGTSAYYLFLWAFFFFSFIDYYLDVWIITDQRIIDIEQKGFFSRIISEQKLFRIQDVTSETNGVFPTLLAYGDVHVQSAGTQQRFFFHEIPEPDKVRDMIVRLIELDKLKNHVHDKA